MFFGGECHQFEVKEEEGGIEPGRLGLATMQKFSGLERESHFLFAFILTVGERCGESNPGIIYKIKPLSQKAT